MTTVLVTGGAGFIGANLCRTLLASSQVSTVVALDNLSTGAKSNLDGIDADLVVGDILDDELLNPLVASADAIVHLAARPSVPRSIADPVASHDANATGTLRVLEAARHNGSPHVIVASSSSVYGANPQLPKVEDMATMPMSPYAASKLATESYALAWQRSYGLPTLAFRFFNVFGPLQAPGHAYAAVVPAFFDAILAGRPVTVHGDGTQSRDFTFVGTVAEVITNAVESTVTHPSAVNLAFGTRTSLLELLDVMERLVGSPIERDHVAPRAGDVPHSQASNDLLRSLFPSVQPTSLDDGLTATLEWFRQR